MIQHQIVQSPARLGLTNPNSPSILNPNPQKLPPSQTHNHQNHRSATPSAALLSLLPPFLRAQALLAQMSTLASNFLKYHPIDLFGSLHSVDHSQHSFLPKPNHIHLPCLSLLRLPLPKKLFHFSPRFKLKSLNLLVNSKKLLIYKIPRRRLMRKSGQKVQYFLHFSNKLKDAEWELDILGDDYSDYCRSNKRLKSGDVSGDDSLATSTVSSQLKLSDILSYAHRISYTTFAPPEFGAGTAPLRGAMPPAPQEEQMRASQLYNFADLDIGLPKAVENQEKTVEAIIEPPPVDTYPLANLSAIQGMLSPNFSIPPGWKPGMPVQLPIDMPIKPPPGWKPGDPVALPPIDPLPVSRFEEPKIPLHIPQPKQPEVIQVQHVNLDLGGTDSSDYSGDEASSNDED